jgi:hypothetical protein
MTEAEQKLSQIPRLSAGELQGWWAFLRGKYTGRNPYPGEIAALMDRAAKLNIKLVD